MTFKIITDSTADLSKEFIEANNITVLGMTITVGEAVYQTIGDQAITNDTLLSEMNKGQKATTSQINSGQFQEAFQSLITDDSELVYLGFSSGLSGTLQSAIIARDMILEENANAKIYLVDTLAAASGEGLLVEEAVKYSQSGKSAKETTEYIETLSKKLNSLFMVDDLNHLAKGGRIPKAVAVVGTMANIKPLMDVDTEGKLRSNAKVRGSKKALKALMDRTLEERDSNYSRIILSYSGSDQTVNEVKKELLDKESNLDISIRPLSPTIVSHTGSGTFAIFSIAKGNRK
ncbi:MAG: DegV family protein [Streptococcaceae bacterium]|nr:DegV family protein [Streptococcaceae bacterium]MCL2858370.1 DegV family protein [Streptococcaceae bacterium]